MRECGGPPGEAAAAPKARSLKQLEAQLAQTDSRAPTVKGFKKYLLAWFRVQRQMYKHYTWRVYPKEQWRRGRRRSEDRFVQRVINTFGQDAILAYGTWCSWQGMLGLPSSPTNSLRRRLAQKLIVIDTCEYQTSSTCSRCGGEAQEDRTRTRTRWTRMRLATK